MVDPALTLMMDSAHRYAARRRADARGRSPVAHHLWGIGIKRRLSWRFTVNGSTNPQGEWLSGQRPNANLFGSAPPRD